MRIAPLHRCQGHMAKAIPLLERTLVLSQETDMSGFDTQAAASLAVVYAWSGQVADTLSLLEQVLEPIPRRPWVYVIYR